MAKQTNTGIKQG